MLDIEIGQFAESFFERRRPSSPDAAVDKLEHPIVEEGEMDLLVEGAGDQHGFQHLGGVPAAPGRAAERNAKVSGCANWPSLRLRTEQGGRRNDQLDELNKAGDTEAG